MEYDQLSASDGTGEAVLANIESDRAIAAITIDVDSVENFPNEFIFCTGTKNANNFITPASMTVGYGHLDSGNVVIDGFAPGYTDDGNTAGQILIIKPTTYWADEIVRLARIVHDDDGKLKLDAPITGGTTLSSGWLGASGTWEYSSWSSTTRIGVITVPSDATTIINVKDRIKITQSTGGTKYGIVVKVAATELTVFFPSGTTLENEAISTPQYSHLASPMGFDGDPVIWELVHSSTTDRSTTSTTFATLTEALTVGIGSWIVGWRGDLDILLSTTPASRRYCTITLTSTGAVEYDRLTANIGSRIPGTANNDVQATVQMEQPLKLTAQKTFTLYGKVSTTGPGPTINLLGGSGVPIIIYARCAYL